MFKRGRVLWPPNPPEYTLGPCPLPLTLTQIMNNPFVTTLTFTYYAQYCCEVKLLVHMFPKQINGMALECLSVIFPTGRNQCLCAMKNEQSITYLPMYVICTYFQACFLFYMPCDRLILCPYTSLLHQEFSHVTAKGWKLLDSSLFHSLSHGGQAKTVSGGGG